MNEPVEQPFWRPIATAKEYGREVLLFVPDAEPQIVVGRLVQNPDCPDSDYWEYSENLLSEALGLVTNPTHWAPKPPDPCADSTEGYCRSCGSPMTKEESLRQDCGGDCLLCMVETGDPDCRQRALRLIQEMD